MKTNFKFTTLLVIVTIALLPVVVAQAAPVNTLAQVDTPSVPSLPDLVETLRNLTGVAMLFAAIVNALKGRVISDSQAPTASLILNAVALVGLVSLQVTNRLDWLPAIDESAGLLATIITSVIALIYNLYVSRKTHENVLSGMPVIGNSFSQRLAGEEYIVEK